MKTLLAGVLVATAAAVPLAPAPALAAGAVSPASVGNDKTYDLTATSASGFYPASQEAVVLRANPALPGQADLSTTVANASACSPAYFVPNADCGSSLKVTVSTLPAQPGTYDVVETQTDQGLTGSTDTTRVLGQVTVYSQPVVTGVSPATRGRNGTSSITVTGTGFAPGATADLGPGITVGTVSVASLTSLTVDLTVGATADLGARAVTITSADGHSGSKDGALTVTPAPVISKVEPMSLLRGGEGDLTVTGQNLVAGDDFSLGISGVTLTNVAVNDAGTKVTAHMASAPSSAYGSRAVRVRNPDGGTAALEGFQVVSPPGAPGPVTVNAGDQTAFVAWSAPTDPGSSAVTAYDVSVSDPDMPTQRVSGTSVSLSGLKNGTALTFSVQAVNSAGVGPASTAVATPKWATALTIGAPAHLTAGQTQVVSGRLTRVRTGAGSPGAAVTVRFAPSGAAAFTRTVTTDVDGRWSTTLPATSTVRVSASFAGRAEDRAASSSAVTTFVATRVTVTGPRSSTVVKVGTTVLVTGSVSPNKKGVAIGLWFGNRQVGRAIIASNGSFRIPVRLARGNYRLDVRIGPTSGNVPGTSKPFILSWR